MTTTRVIKRDELTEAEKQNFDLIMASVKNAVNVVLFPLVKYVVNWQQLASNRDLVDEVRKSFPVDTTLFVFDNYWSKMDQYYFVRHAHQVMGRRRKHCAEATVSK